MYKAPSQEIFEEMKQKAADIWRTYDNTYWYVDEKLERVNGFWNIQDNAMTFYRMFDSENQEKFNRWLSEFMMI